MAYSRSPTNRRASEASGRDGFGTLMRGRNKLIWGWREKMMVYYKKLRAKEAAGRDGAMTRSVQGYPLVLNLKLRWVFNTTQSCSELVVIGAESGVRLSFQQRDDKVSVLHRDYCVFVRLVAPLLLVQLPSNICWRRRADTFRPCRDK